MSVMRRHQQQLDQEVSLEILRHSSSGVLSLIDEEGFPYGVPLNYVLYEGNLYFHCATEGKKLLAIASHPAASFTVIERDEVVSELYTSLFRSVIVFGTIKPIEGERWTEAFDAFCDKYSADRPLAERRQKVRSCTKAIGLMLTVEQITGKEAKELANISYS
ncbi:MAG: 5-nitroimidazole antibiotic resistance protein [Spirochaetales bacterium]|nr:5-nitroimidazole antibiotic resistance protein [Spirochaetales bacterium]